MCVELAVTRTTFPSTDLIDLVDAAVRAGDAVRVLARVPALVALLTAGHPPEAAW